MNITKFYLVMITFLRCMIGRDTKGGQAEMVLCGSGKSGVSLVFLRLHAPSFTVSGRTCSTSPECRKVPVKRL